MRYMKADLGFGLCFFRPLQVLPAGKARGWPGDRHFCQKSLLLLSLQNTSQSRKLFGRGKSVWKLLRVRQSVGC